MVRTGNWNIASADELDNRDTRAAYRAWQRLNGAQSSESALRKSTERPIPASAHDSIQGIWRFRGQGHFQGGFLVLGSGRFSIVGDAIDKEPEGTWRHDPTAIPTELDLEFTENGPPEAQIGIYRLEGVYGETTKMLTIWFAQPGQDRPDGPSDKAARIALYFETSALFNSGLASASIAFRTHLE